jgi:hypothetical protein
MIFTNPKGDISFPPKMAVDARYLPQNYKMTKKPPPFSFDIREAVKRQIAFARKITSIYPHDPAPSALLLDSQQRYAKPNVDSEINSIAMQCIDDDCNYT